MESHALSSDSEDEDYRPGSSASSNDGNDADDSAKDSTESPKNKRRKMNLDSKYLPDNSDLNSTNSCTVADHNRIDNLWKDFIGAPKPSALSPLDNSLGDRSYDDRPQTDANFSGYSIALNIATEADSLNHLAFPQEPKNDLAVNSKIPSTSTDTEKQISTSGKQTRQVGGLQSVMSKIMQPQKKSVLQKTQSDWLSFKESHGLDEELSQHNRGKQGFLEKKDFLERVDVRQFEREKNIRQFNRSKRGLL